jgi:chromatin segregation and condensation protein Rec8/ScpA/Scc1 (kleisin family)
MLAAAFAHALNAAQARPMVVKRETFSVVVKMNYLLRELKRSATMSLFAMLEDCPALEIVVTFLAALELVRAHKIVFEQPTPFGDITFRLASKEGAVRLAQSA